MKRNFEEIGEAFNLVNYYQNYQKENNIISNENVNKFTTILIKELEYNPIITKIVLNNSEIDDLVIIAALRALKYGKNNITNLTLELMFDMNMSTEVADLLHNNSNIKTLTLSPLDELTEESAQLIAVGIKGNTSINRIITTDGFYENCTKILFDAIRNKENIYSLKIYDLIRDDNSILYLSDYLSSNKNIIYLFMDFDSDHENIDYNPLIQALKTNNNLRAIRISDAENVPYSIKVDYETIINVRNLMRVNKILVTFPNFTENDQSDIWSDIGKLLNNNNLLKEKTQFFFKTYLTNNQNVNIKSLPNTCIKPLIIIEKIHPHTLKVELQEIYPHGTEEQKDNWDNIMARVNKDKNDNFFYLQGITKDICKNGLVQDLWSKIASYLSFEDIKSSKNDTENLDAYDLSLSGISSNTEEAFS